jgi:hypothetical protein
VNVKDARVVKGARVVAHIKHMLQQHIGAHLRHAFAKLEKEKGATVDVTKGWGVVGQASPTVRPISLGVPGSPARLLRASVTARQQWSLSDDNVELIFLPAIEQDGYWLGTFVATHYDDVGNADVYEIINVEMTYTQPTAAGWDTTYSDPVYEGPPPDHDPMEGGHLIAGSAGATVRHAQLSGTDRMEIRRVGLKWLGKYKGWLGCSAAWCAGAAGGCALGHWWNAEILWAPCTGIGCAGAMVGCTYGSLWEWQ